MENNIDNVIESLEQVSDAFFIWFKNNRLKNNIDKRHLLVSTKKPVGIKFGDNTIDDIECEKLLGVKIDVNVKFNGHISDLCQKASRKISALARVIPFMGLSKRKLLKELRNRISHIFCFSTNSFRKLVFHCSAVFVFSACCYVSNLMQSS